LNEFEFENALLFQGWRKILSVENIDAVRGAYLKDLEGGSLLYTACDLAAVMEEARRLSSVHTLRTGHRSFHILHVAAALRLGATDFFSFDRNQRILARAEGLQLNPA
jgi:hypothetical protein